jgi:hypothetical protein
MTRHWVSWWGPDLAQEAPFLVWVTGQRSQFPELSFAAVIDAENEREVWGMVGASYPSFEPRFIEAKEPGWSPGDRFR